MIQAVVPLTVSVKLSSFRTNSPENWFIQAEAQVENKRITASHTKFTHFVAALPQDVACRLLDLWGFKKMPNSDVFPEWFQEVPGLAEFAFFVKPTPLLADGKNVHPPPWRQETRIFLQVCSGTVSQLMSVHIFSLRPSVTSVGWQHPCTSSIWSVWGCEYLPYRNLSVKSGLHSQVPRYADGEMRLASVKLPVALRKLVSCKIFYYQFPSILLPQTLYFWRTLFPHTSFWLKLEPLSWVFHTFLAILMLQVWVFSWELPQWILLVLVR